jgi:hypothetical protein
MAKKTDYYKLTNAQKEEVRRLTQLANRRIGQAFKEYEKEGKTVAPYDVTGGIQTREQWETEKYALSRSIKFETKKDYQQRLHWLRQFEHLRPSMTEYTATQREKTLQGVETSFGVEPPKALQDIINSLSAAQLSTFWKKFSDISSKMGMKYSSNAALEAAVNEFLGEDINNLSLKLTAGLSNDIATRQLTKQKAVKAPRKKQPKTKRGRKKAAKKAGKKK